jgi:enamine deaminase RidA (YjgF/YER057c/UK114 family)
MDIEARLNELNITLPTASEPQGSYRNCVRTGNLLYVSGKGPNTGMVPAPSGKLGLEYQVEQGYQFARQAGLDILSTVQFELGSLNKVCRVVKLQGFVNSTADFQQHPQVLDGCSDLMVEVFGTKGIHARSVFGATSVRSNLPIIVDSIFEVIDTHVL